MKTIRLIMNIKNLILISTFFVFSIGHSQDNNQKKLVSIISLDLNATNKSTYENYDIDNNIHYITSLRGKGSIGLEYNIDYKILKKLSITGIASLINYNDNPRFGSMKIGSGFKLVYSNHNYHYLTLQYGYHIPFSKSDFREGHQIKIGQAFDLANIFNKRLLLGFYYTTEIFDIRNTSPLINRGYRYDPKYLRTNSYGISLGIKF